jgi:transposase
MTKQVEVITSVQRRRRWRAAEKERIVAASLEPGAVVSALGREAGIQPSQLYGWRRQMCAAAPVVAAAGVEANRSDDPPTFAPVRLTSQSALAAVAATPAGAIEIEFASGARMRINGAVDVATVTAAVAQLARRERRR